MAFDTHGSLLSGKAALACLVYIGASLYVSGPLIAERTIERSGWDTGCETAQEAYSSGREPALPSFDCHSLLGWLGPSGRELCDRHGTALLNLPALVRQTQFGTHAPPDEQTERNRSRCACAVNATLEQNRTAFAVYAGSVRLITPAAVRNLRTALSSSLHSRTCTFETQ